MFSLLGLTTEQHIDL